jgi:hypothetical protein
MRRISPNYPMQASGQTSVTPPVKDMNNNIEDMYS